MMSSTMQDIKIKDMTPLADCSLGNYRETLLVAGSCKPGACCVTAASGRQIDRFFRAHPGFAADYTQDGFWERGAIAARYLPASQLQPLLTDPDEAVRRVLAYRVPLEWLPDFCVTILTGKSGSPSPTGYRSNSWN
jgi:LRV protein FeS4 cluster